MPLLQVPQHVLAADSVKSGWVSLTRRHLDVAPNPRVHVLSSALKLGTAGLSAVVTGSAQGALAYYSTWVVGQAAERYLAQGKSWGEGGPKLVVREILDSIDRDTLISDARREIRKRLAS